jgi:hypothetical protein
MPTSYVNAAIDQCGGFEVPAKLAGQVRAGTSNSKTALES